jgi:hypothetical protein
MRLGLRTAAVAGVLAALQLTAAAAAADERSEVLIRALTNAGGGVSPPLTSDREHAFSGAPVLTPAAVTWIHLGGDAAADSAATPVLVQEGRVFTYRDAPHDPVAAPRLRIRPIDDDQQVPFLARVKIRAAGDDGGDARIVLVFPGPLVFRTEVRDLRAWAGSTPLETAVEISPSTSDITAAVTIPATLLAEARRRGGDLPVVLEGMWSFAEYDVNPPERFADSGGSARGAAVESLARPSVTGEAELTLLSELASSIAGQTSTLYETIVAVNRWVSSRLSYREVPVARPLSEVLADSTGDCDDYASLMVALLRARGLPSRRTAGFLYDLDRLVAHAWVEAALPIEDGELHWFICDPTLASRAGTDQMKERFVQFKDRVLLYDVQPVVAMNGAVRGNADLLLHWRRPGERGCTDGERCADLLEAVVAGADRELVSRVEVLSERGLMLQRELSRVPGSRYVVLERPESPGAAVTVTAYLENEERLALVMKAPAGRDLDGGEARESIDSMREAYARIVASLFGGREARSNVELVFDRDRHSDRLGAVTLRLGRALLESQLDRVVRILVGHGLLTKEEAHALRELSEASGGRNLYVLQELARAAAL